MLCKEVRFTVNWIWIIYFCNFEGLYRFKRLNFGTNAALEILQSILDEILRNLLNCMAIPDDVILFAISFDIMYDTLDKILNWFFWYIKQRKVQTIYK